MKRVNGLWMTVVCGLALFGCSAADARDIEPEAQATRDELTNNALTKKQAATVLKLVDDICGDTWCEGDHNFRFDAIQCQAGCGKKPGTCRLTLCIFPYDSDPKTGPTYVRSCTTSGFENFASLVDTAANGYQSLNWEYYDALTACIDRLESNLP